MKHIGLIVAGVFVVMVMGSVSTYAGVSKTIKVKQLYGPACSVTESCGDMVYIDCGAAADGPAYYLDKNLEVIGTSGGLCMAGCSGAPKEWRICQGRKIK